MKKIISILFTGLLVLATTTFAQDTNSGPSNNQTPAITKVHGNGFHGPAFQRGWDERQNLMDRNGPMMKQSPRQGGPRGPMFNQSPRGGKGKCQCPCHEKQRKGKKGKGHGKQHRGR